MKVLPLKECDASAISKAILDFLNEVRLISLGEKKAHFLLRWSTVMLG